MSKVVTFYFGAASRYSYLATSKLAAISKANGVRFDWVPLDVLKLFDARGRSPFAPGPVSGQYEGAWRRQDAERWAALYGMPFIEPMGRLSLDMNLLARACAAAGMIGEVEPYARALMQRIFAATDLQVDMAGCIDAAVQCGIDREIFGAALSGVEPGRRVDDIVKQASARGVFGVPSFVVDGEVFWGNDRLPLLEHCLAGSSRTRHR